MKYTDIAIIGGGLAGSTAAAMLGRARIPTILIDRHQVYPFDFRVENISGHEQLDRFYQTGIADSVLRSATHDGENWIARFGYLLDRKPSRQFGIMYDALIAAIRAEIRPPAELICAKVTDVSTSAERQKLTLSDGETISARLVVLANGLSVALRRNLGIKREIISACHSISIGFDLRCAIKAPRSLLVIILVVLVVVVGLTGGVMLPVALVVPELAIDAVGRQQLRGRAALDRLAA